MTKSIFGAMPRMVDPPSGWRYGFPKRWDPVKAPDLKEWFISEGYPEEDIELAMKYSRN